MKTTRDMQTRKKVITALIVIVLFLGLLFAARFLVNSINFVEILQRMHGG